MDAEIDAEIDAGENVEFMIRNDMWIGLKWTKISISPSGGQPTLYSVWIVFS